MKDYAISTSVLLVAGITFIGLIGSTSFSNETSLYLLLLLGLLTLALITIRLVQTYGWPIVGYSLIIAEVAILVLLLFVWTNPISISTPTVRATPTPEDTILPMLRATPTNTPEFSLPNRPTTAPTSTPPINQLISDAVDRLAQGQIAFNPPNEMRLGESYKILVRITQNETEKAREELKAGLIQTGTIVQIEPIRVSSEMKAELTTLQDEDINIFPLSEGVQPLGQNSHTEWQWSVTPLRSGVKTLFLKVSAIIRIPGESLITRSIRVMEKEINIKVNVMYSLQTFTSNYWQWLLLSVVNTVLGWLIVKRKPQSFTTIHTGGGTYVEGNVDTKGDFVGRDKSENIPDED